MRRQLDRDVLTTRAASAITLLQQDAQLLIERVSPQLDLRVHAGCHGVGRCRETLPLRCGLAPGPLDLTGHLERGVADFLRLRHRCPAERLDHAGRTGLVEEA